MIVFSLTLFLFSSFTFFYKIRISKKPRTPRSTTWWVCLFKQCQCSCSRCTDLLCWLGGCTRCPSCVGSPVPSKERARARHFARVTALERALTCYLCPSHACFHETYRDFSPFSLRALCLSVGCVLNCSVYERGVGQITQADLQAAWSYTAPLETMPKPNCCALSSLQWEDFIFSRGILCSSQNAKATGNAEKRGWFHLSDITCLRADLLESKFKSLLPGSLSLCQAFPRRCRWQVRSAIPAGAHQRATGNGHFPVKEHSSRGSATNYFLCYGETRWLFSPVTVKPRQSYGKNTKNHWIAIHNSSMSTLLTCQIINPFQFGTMHMNSVCNSFFLSLE